MARTSSNLGPYLPIFFRAMLQVALVAWNVVNLSRGEYGLAFVSGAAVSFVWWTNARTSALSDAPYGRYAYALGAGVGTVAGMGVGAWL